MSLQDRIEQLDTEMKNLNLPFDKGLPVLQKRLWEIADEFGITGPEVFTAYMNWKSESK